MDTILKLNVILVFHNTTLTISDLLSNNSAEPGTFVYKTENNAPGLYLLNNLISFFYDGRGKGS